jgi:hypothetical protein
MIKDQKIKLIARMNDLRKLIPDTIEAINSLPNGINGDMYIFLDPGVLRITIQYLPKEYLSTKRKLSEFWQYTKHEFNNRSGNVYVYFQHRFLEVELTLELEIAMEYQPGVACKLVEVDHKTEVIYGLECK